MSVKLNIVITNLLLAFYETIQLLLPLDRKYQENGKKMKPKTKIIREITSHHTLVLHGHMDKRGSKPHKMTNA